jgi:hypothetical protein
VNYKGTWIQTTVHREAQLSHLVEGEEIPAKKVVQLLHKISSYQITYNQIQPTSSNSYTDPAPNLSIAELKFVPGQDSE